MSNTHTHTDKPKQASSKKGLGSMEAVLPHWAGRGPPILAPLSLSNNKRLKLKQEWNTDEKLFAKNNSDTQATYS